MLHNESTCPIHTNLEKNGSLSGPASGSSRRRVEATRLYFPPEWRLNWARDAPKGLPSVRLKDKNTHCCTTIESSQPPQYAEYKWMVCTIYTVEAYVAVAKTSKQCQEPPAAAIVAKLSWVFKISMVSTSGKRLRRSLPPLQKSTTVTFSPPPLLVTRSITAKAMFSNWWHFFSALSGGSFPPCSGCTSAGISSQFSLFAPSKSNTLGPDVESNFSIPDDLNHFMAASMTPVNRENSMMKSIVSNASRSRQELPLYDKDYYTVHSHQFLKILAVFALTKLMLMLANLNSLDQHKKGQQKQNGPRVFIKIRIPSARVPFHFSFKKWKCIP